MARAPRKPRKRGSKKYRSLVHRFNAVSRAQSVKTIKKRGTAFHFRVGGQTRGQRRKAATRSAALGVINRHYNKALKRQLFF